jgi:outer membrane protein insertion porin family
VTTGLSAVAGVPLNEFLSLQLRYTLSYDEVSLDPNIYFFNGSCDPLIAGRYLCDAIGNRTTSLAGYSLIYDNRDNRVRPTRGQSLTLSQDFAGLGGSVRYIRSRAAGSAHWRPFGNFILSAYAEGGYIHPLGDNGLPAGADRVRLTDRFFLGEPQMRGFDIRGVGPRVIRYTDVDLTNNMMPVVNEERRARVDDALGGRAYYQGRLELEIPLGSGARELGLRPSIFADIGSVWSVRTPTLTTLESFRDTDGNYKTLCRNQTTGATQFGTQTIDTTTGLGVGEFNNCPAGFSGIRPFDERFFGNSPSPRLSVGFGVNWRSPFGPFRIDIARALLREEGDDTKLFTFNVGTNF